MINSTISPLEIQHSRARPTFLLWFRVTCRFIFKFQSERAIWHRHLADFEEISNRIERKTFALMRSVSFDGYDSLDYFLHYFDHEIYSNIQNERIPCYFYSYSQAKTTWITNFRLLGKMYWPLGNKLQPSTENGLLLHNSQTYMGPWRPMAEHSLQFKYRNVRKIPKQIPLNYR